MMWSSIIVVIIIIIIIIIIIVYTIIAIIIIVKDAETNKITGIVFSADVTIRKNMITCELT